MMIPQGPTELYRASGPNPIFYSPSMESKNHRLPAAVRPVLPPGPMDWTIGNTGAEWQGQGAGAEGRRVVGMRKVREEQSKVPL